MSSVPIVVGIMGFSSVGAGGAGRFLGHSSEGDGRGVEQDIVENDKAQCRSRPTGGSRLVHLGKVEQGELMHPVRDAR